MSKPEWTGVLDLEIEERADKSVTKDIYFQGSLKLQRPIYHNSGKIPTYYILNTGGGYLDGDKYRMRVRLHDGAKLTLTTQSATKIYKTPNRQAYQETEIQLGRNSYLEYLPDPLIAYINATYHQKSTVYLEKGAALFYSEILTPGWSPQGDHFSYNALKLINEIYMEDELIAFDHLKLLPGKQRIGGIGFMEGYTHLGSLVVIGDQTDKELIDEIYDAINEVSGDFKAGISALDTPGFTIRMMANSTQTIERVVTDCHRIINMTWFQTEPRFLRKY